MSTPSSAETQVLDQIEQALRSADESSACRVRDLDALPSTELTLAALDAWQDRLRSWSDRLVELEALAERPKQAIVEPDAVFAEGEASLRRWVGESEEIERKLADWDARAVR